jgi:hypothetical protein
MNEIGLRTPGLDLRGVSEDHQTPAHAPERVTIALAHSAEVASGDTSACGIEVQLRATFEDLQLHLHRTVPETLIRGCVARAYRDLRGSVNSEALPEMAGRLAAERLHVNGFTVGRTSPLTAERNPARPSSRTESTPNHKNRGGTRS